MAISPVDIAYYATLGEGHSEGSGEGQGFLLSDDEWLRTHGIYAKAAKAAEDAGRIGGAVTRGAKQRQRRFFEAAGLGGALSDRASLRLAPGTQQIGFDLAPGVREAYEAEINKGLQTVAGVRQGATAGLATGAGMEGVIGGAILKSNPFTAPFAPLHEGLSAAKGAFYSAAPTALPAIAAEQRREAGTYREPMDEYETSIARLGGATGDSRSLPYTGRGGGGADFFRNYQV